MRNEMRYLEAAWLLVAARVMNVTVFVIAVTVLGGWFFDNSRFQSLLLDLPTMKFNTALALGLLAFAAITRSFRVTKGGQCATASAAVFAGLLAIVSLLDSYLGLGSGLATIVVADPASIATGSPPGEMSSGTAFCVLLLSLVNLPVSRPKWFANFGCIAVLCASAYSLACYLFLPETWRIATPFSSTALHTSFLLTLLGAAAMMQKASLSGFAACQRAPSLLDFCRGNSTWNCRLTMACLVSTWFGGILLSTVAAIGLENSFREQEQQRFTVLVDNIEDDIRVVAYRPIYELYGVRILFLGSEEVTPEEFNRYVETLDFENEFPGVQGFGFLRRVSPRDKVANTAQLLRIKTADNSEERFQIEFRYPNDFDWNMWGPNLYEFEACQQAARAAIHTGEPTISAPILFNDNDSNSGYLSIVPVYEPGWNVDDPQAIQKLKGLLFAPTRLDRAVSNSALSKTLAAVRIFDGAKLKTTAQLFGSNLTKNPASCPEFSRTLSFPINGREWSVLVQSNEVFESNSYDRIPVYAMVGGLSVTILGASLAWVLGLGRARALSMVKDRTAELEDANNRLRKQSENLTTTIQSVPFSLLMINREGEIVLATDEAEQMFGYDHGELKGERIERLLPEKYRDAHVGKRESFFQDPSARRMAEGREVVALRKGGTEFPIEAGLRPINTTEGTFVVCGLVDVSTRNQALSALRESEGRFRTTADSCPVAMWIFDEHSDCSWLSKRWLEYTGTDIESQLGQGWFESIHPDDHQQVIEAFRHLVANVSRCELVFRLRRHDGEFRRHRSFVMPRVNDSGKLLGYVGVSVDEHDELELRDELKKSYESLKEQQAINRSTIDNSANLIMLLTFDGEVSDLNSTALRHCGLKKVEVLGLPVWETPLWNHCPEFQEELRQLILKATLGRTVDFETDHLSVDGSAKIIEWTFSRVRDEFDSYDHVIAEGRDVTPHKNREQDLPTLLEKFDAAKLDLEEANARLVETKNQAVAASNAKSEFLANMSHEIRTPMNAIIGLTDLMLKSNMDSTNRDYLQTVYGSAESLLQIINDILDFSKIEAGKLSLESIDFQIRELLDDSMKSLAHRAYEQGIELSYHCDWNVPEMLVGDPGRLRQIVVNMVGNAIKFTKEGHVLVEVSCSDEKQVDSDRVQLEFSITDTGIGIAPDKIAAIFERFEQADSRSTRRFGGTGLGLTISSRLVEAMGGEISVTSEIGQGSTFSFTAELKTSTVQQTQPWREVISKLEHSRVLVVDDHAVNRTVLQQMLQSFTNHVECAKDGVEALEYLTSAIEEDEPFDIMVTDFSMPEMDGLDLTETIRAKLAPEQMPVILLVSSVDLIDESRAKSLGINGKLLKPVNQSYLLEMMIHSLGLAGAIEDVVVAPNDGGYRGTTSALRVLVAEDSIPNQKLASAILRSEGHSLVIANNGKDAVKYCQSDEFDLILMDVQMPQMDGLEATVAIRDLEKGQGKRTPIIALTAHALKGDREKCIAAGMDDYVTKPLRPDLLFQAIERVIGTSFEKKTQTQQDDVEPSASSIPWQQLLATVGNDLQAFTDIVEAYEQEMSEVVPELTASINDNDLQRIERNAHQLKSAFRFFQVSDAIDLAQSIESHGDEHDPQEVDLQETWSQLQGIVMSLLTEIGDYLRDNSPPPEATLQESLNG